MPNKPRYLFDEVGEAQVVKFIEQWMFVLGHLARYPSANRIVAQSMRELYEMLPEIWGRRTELEFAELHNTLLINGAPLTLGTQNKDSVGAFLFIFLQHNLRSLTIRRQVELEEFQKLLQKLADPPGPHNVDMARLLQKDEVRHIEIEQHFHTGFDQSSGISSSVPKVEVGSASGKPMLAADELVEPEPATTVPKRPDPRYARDEIRGPGKMRVQFIIRVGQLALQNVEIKIEDSVEPPKYTKGEGGAILFLPPGEVQLLLRYENFEIRQLVEIREENQVFDIDLQKISHY